MLRIQARDITNGQDDLPVNCLSDKESALFGDVVRRVNAERKSRGQGVLSREQVIVMLMRRAIKSLSSETAPAQSPAPAQSVSEGSE